MKQKKVVSIVARTSSELTRIQVCEIKGHSIGNYGLHGEEPFCNQCGMTRDAILGNNLSVQTNG